MPRIIINYPEGMTEHGAIQLVSSVINGGRVSNQGKQFCYATTFASGAIVYTNLTSNGTDVFHITGDFQTG